MEQPTPTISYLTNPPRMISSIAYDPPRVANLRSFTPGENIVVMRAVQAETEKWIFIKVDIPSDNQVIPEDYYYIESNADLELYAFNEGGKLVTKKAKFVWKVDRVTSQPKGSCKCEAYSIQDPRSGLYWTACSGKESDPIVLEKAINNPNSDTDPTQAFGIGAI